MNALELLDAARKAQNLPSDYSLAARAGLTRGAVSGYRNGRSIPDDQVAQRLAELAGLDPDAVIASMHAHRAANPAQRAIWQRIALRLAASVPALMVGLVGFSGGPDAGASTGQANAESGGASLYIM